ncbi:unnamed protein product [Phytophthora fragariaefolia]|uniref:Unnamed protein product n=1 Tax=Phytophthora fragariaefolia TaxID=1490495 RepID=A0A9W7CRB0_9STRA|nr:unnamed protein product [Phytophthora fragariaefolia]
MDFVGPMLDCDVAQAIADGDMDPITMTRFPRHATPLRRPSIQPIPPKVNRTPLAPPVKTNTPITSFFHASESAAPAMFNAPRPSSSSGKRKLPPSFMDKWTAKAPSPKGKTSEVGDTATVNKSAAASPLLTSRFFGGKPKKMSPPDESVKKNVTRSLDISSMYQSQEPRGVDVARNISFDPMNDNAKSLQNKSICKENQSPNSQEIPSNPVLPVKETAFSRMMRAGSMLQQHKLKKRKNSGSGFRGGALHTRQQVPLSSRMGQFAFRGIKTDTSPRVNCDLAVVQLTTVSVSTTEHVDEQEVTLDPDDGAVIEPKATPSTLDQQHTSVPESAVVGSESSPIASFDRFRFQQ